MTGFSGKGFQPYQNAIHKRNKVTIVIARPQNVAVAISRLRMTEIASLRSQ